MSGETAKEKDKENVEKQEIAALGLKGPKVARRNCQGAAKGGIEQEDAKNASQVKSKDEGVC